MPREIQFPIKRLLCKRKKRPVDGTVTAGNTIQYISLQYYSVCL